MTRAYIGLGANLGERLHTLSEALKRVDDLPETAVVAVSRVYESEPWPDPADPPFANAVAVVETALEADVLLRLMGEIEEALGREPAPANAPRPVDLDIIIFGDEEWTGPELVIPHPRFAEREFVVLPLLEVDPLVTLPDGSPVSAENVRVGRVTRLLGVLPGFADITHARADAGEAEDEWVVVAEGGDVTVPGQVPGADTLLLLERSVLEQEGIPFSWDPYPPELWTNPWGLKGTFRILVPASLAERARTLLREVLAAPPEPMLSPEDYGGEEPEE